MALQVFQAKDPGQEPQCSSGIIGFGIEIVDKMFICIDLERVGIVFFERFLEGRQGKDEQANQQNKDHTHKDEIPALREWEPW